MKNSTSAFVLAMALCGCAVPRCARTPAEIFQQINRSAVVVHTEEGLGSGTIVRGDAQGGYILTCAHVITLGADGLVPAQHVLVKWWRGDDVRVAPATILAFDKEKDLALLRIEGDFTGLALPVATKEPNRFDNIYTVGTPSGFSGTVAHGWLSRKDMEVFGRPRWKVDQTISLHGISGGTSTNASGELVCVPEATPLDDQDPVSVINICVGLSDIRAFLGAHLKG